MRESSSAAVGEPASWRPILVLIGCTIAITLNVVGIFNGTQTAFINPMSQEAGWSRAQVSLGLSLAMFALLVVNPFVGRFADRFGPRNVIAVGAPVLGIAVAALGWLPSVYPIYLLGCAIVGIAGALTFNPLYYALIAKWFDRRLGLALGTVSAGTGVGLMIAPIAAQALIADLGWRGAYAALGAFSTIIVLALTFLLLRDGPKSASTGGEQGRKGAFADLKSVLFWRLAFVYCLAGLAINGTVIHLMPLITDRGISPEVAAGIAAVTGLGVFIARLGIGFILDYADAGLIGAVCFVVGALGIGLLITDIPVPYLALAVFLMGVALGGEGDLLAFMARRAFGMQNYGVNISVLSSAFLLGVLSGPPLNGLSYDQTGSYATAMIGFVVIMLVAAALHAGATLGRPRPNTEAKVEVQSV